MESNPNSYVIMLETKDNVFKVLTNKLNVREAREKLEVVNIALSKVELKEGEEAHVLRAFIYNMDALSSTQTEGKA